MSSIIKPPLGTVLNPFHPLSQGLVGYWLFNEGAGSLAQDISGKGNHGRLTNMAPNVQGSGWGGSKFGGGLQFDGVDDYVNAPASDTEFLGAITISMWARIDTGGNYRHFAGKHLTNGATNDPFDFRTNNAATPLMHLVRANASANEWSGPAVTLGQMKHYVVTFPSDIAIDPTFYINGAGTTGSKITGTATGVSIGSNADIRIGIRVDAVVKMHGLIDEVRIYNRELLALEVKQLYLDPFCNLMTRTPSGLYVPTAGGLSIPVAMYHYNQLVRA